MTKYRSKNFIFEKPLKNGCKNMCHTLIFVLNQKKIFFTFFLPFFAFFSTLPKTQTIKVINLVFFSMSWPWKIGLWTCISTRVSIRKNFCTIFAERIPKIFFRCESVLREKTAIWAIIRKSHFSQNCPLEFCAIPQFRYNHMQIQKIKL